jgi:hypothetical protein
MRVTKTVKEYISKKVAEKYKPLIAEIDLEYKVKKEEVNKKIECAVAEFEKQLKAIVVDNNDKWTFDVVERYGERKILSWYEVSDKKAENRYWQMKRNLEEEKNEKIENIIVELELGGTRETLERMLSEI